jgi:lysozyme family protein
MADISLFSPKILQFEGGFVDDPVDKGGATNMGVTFVTFQAVFGRDKTVEDLKNMTIDQFTMVLKKYFWDRWKADQINNQSVAEILVDWVWGSGHWGITIPQRILGVKADGAVGPATLAALNGADQGSLFEKIKQARFVFINDIILNDPTQEKFEKGWVSRVSSYQFSL